jgi:hypothetical protein
MEMRRTTRKKKCITFRDFIFILIKYNTPQPQSRSSTNHQSAFVALATFSLFFFLHGEEKKSDVDDMDGPLNVVVFRQLKISVPISRVFFSPQYFPIKAVRKFFSNSSPTLHRKSKHFPFGYVCVYSTVVYIEITTNNKTITFYFLKI